MDNLFYLILGFIFGGLIMVIIMSCFSIRKINQLESRCNQLKKDNEKKKY